MAEIAHDYLIFMDECCGLLILRYVPLLNLHCLFSSHTYCFLQTIWLFDVFFSV